MTRARERESRVLSGSDYEDPVVACDKNCTDSKKGPVAALRDGRDESAQGKKSSRMRREKDRGGGGRRDMKRSDKENDREGRRDA